MKTLTERFWSKVDVRGEGDCWLWMGATKQGYGWFWRGDFADRAHRVAWELAFGPITNPDLCVCHTCDVRACVNPAHFFLGTRADNSRDAAAKGRLEYGERRRNAKLTAPVVRGIRTRAAAGETRRAIAADVGVSATTVSLIVSGRKWRRA